MDASFIPWIILFAYAITGVVVARLYYRKRHGVSFKPENAGAAVLLSSVFYLALVWPLVFILPNLRNPEPCAHVEHIEARARTNAAAALYRAERQK
ncbi:hypothetical protein ACIBCN_01765 [Nocardia sp. NPDC051052]|uniref:hypothetical protein n=1 Tax=Nocardia sp. NPDC051052 TaxID=3364322 RepID=UPI0037B202C1